MTVSVSATAQFQSPVGTAPFSAASVDVYKRQLQAVVAMHLNGLIVPVEVPFKYAAPTALTPAGGLSGNRMGVSFQAGFSPQPGDY